MPDGESPSDTAGPVLSRYGRMSALLAVLALAAVVALGVIWSHHHGEVADRLHQTRAMRAAAEWTAVLINLNKDNLDASLQTLQEGTVGELNENFEAVVEPYREVVTTLRVHTTGRIEAVAVESIHHDPDVPPGAPPPSDAPPVPLTTSRTDTVLVVATSVSDNSSGKPQTVRWNLLLDVADIDGKLLVSRLVSLR